MSNQERRFIIPIEHTRVEQNANGETVITGYGSVFGQKSKLLFERGKFFYEIIDKGAFDTVLSDPNLNAILTYNHDRSQILGRTTSKTLQLTSDDYGLKYTATLPSTTLARDLTELIKRNDIFESSFVFTVDKEGEKWTKTNEGWIRNIMQVSGLYDVSLVPDGAYSNTFMQLTERQQEILDERVIDEETTGTTEQTSAESDFMAQCIPPLLDSGEAQDEAQAYAICKAKFDKGEPPTHSNDEKLIESNNLKLIYMEKDLEILKKTNNK